MNGSFERSKQALAEVENTKGPYAGVTIKVIEEPKGYSPEEVRLKASFASSQHRKISSQADRPSMTALQIRNLSRVRS
jgi:hypothetical protein